MLRTRCIGVVSAVVALAGLASVSTAFVPWSNPNGNTAAFAWANGGSDTGLFGSPVLVGNTFTFFPSMFRAQSVNGSPSIVYDRLEFDVYANGNFFFTGIEIVETGDYGVFGTPGGSVSVTGNMFLTNLDTTAVLTDALVTNPVSPILAGSGRWDGQVDVDLAAQNPHWTRLKVVLNNNLIAVSLPGGISFIEKKVAGAGVGIRIIPTPGSMALLAMGGVVMARRRREN